MVRHRSKLGASYYFDLVRQFECTPDPNDGSISSSGEHYQLIALLDKMGFRTRTREQALDLAQQLLSNGYDPD